jgi:hypothetical protein
MLQPVSYLVHVFAANLEVETEVLRCVDVDARRGWISFGFFKIVNVDCITLLGGGTPPFSSKLTSQLMS